MQFDEKLIQDLVNDSIANFYLILEKKKIPLSNVIITQSSTPLKKPSIRGGVYFSDTTSYRIKATTDDLSIIPLMSKTMLGPNPEFSEIKITTAIKENGAVIPISLFANLTNSMESNSKLELDMVIVRASKNDQ